MLVIIPSKSPSTRLFASHRSTEKLEPLCQLHHCNIAWNNARQTVPIPAHSSAPLSLSYSRTPGHHPPSGYRQSPPPAPEQRLSRDPEIPWDGPHHRCRCPRGRTRCSLEGFWARNAATSALRRPAHWSVRACPECHLQTSRSGRKGGESGSQDHRGPAHGGGGNRDRIAHRPGQGQDAVAGTGTTSARWVGGWVSE